MSREELIDFGADEDALFLSESWYDKAIIGICDGRICYDENKIISILMEHDKVDYLQALEYYEINIAGAYMGGDDTALYHDRCRV